MINTQSFVDIYDQYSKNCRSAVLDSLENRIGLFDFIVGDIIGYGETRVVFEFPLNIHYVIKYDFGVKNDNAIENEIWSEVKDQPKIAKWLAPCIQISNCGKWLVMEKTEKPMHLPKKLPKFLSDHHTNNYGIIDGNFVCHDYGNTQILNINSGKNLLELEEIDWR